MEEIDIIELLQRVKEGKAPKKIMIREYIYELDGHSEYFREGIDGQFYNLTDDLSIFDMIMFNTKIKILDKPIIEELDEHEIWCVDDMVYKINEIIKHINNKEE